MRVRVCGVFFLLQQEKIAFNGFRLEKENERVGPFGDDPISPGVDEVQLLECRCSAADACNGVLSTVSLPNFVSRFHVSRSRFLFVSDSVTIFACAEAPQGTCDSFELSKVSRDKVLTSLSHNSKRKFRWGQACNGTFALTFREPLPSPPPLTESIWDTVVNFERERLRRFCC